MRHVRAVGKRLLPDAPDVLPQRHAGHGVLVIQCPLADGGDRQSAVGVRNRNLPRGGAETGNLKRRPVLDQPESQPGFVLSCEADWLRPAGVLRVRRRAARNRADAQLIAALRKAFQRKTGLAGILFHGIRAVIRAYAHGVVCRALDLVPAERQGDLIQPRSGRCRQRRSATARRAEQYRAEQDAKRQCQRHEATQAIYGRSSHFPSPPLAPGRAGIRHVLCQNLHSAPCPPPPSVFIARLSRTISWIHLNLNLRTATSSSRHTIAIIRNTMRGSVSRGRNRTK